MSALPRPRVVDRAASLVGCDKPTTSVAPPPFDDPKADLIIRSSDNIHFYVHKLLLSIVSPVFEGMFALPDEPSQEVYDNHPCLPVSDDSDHLICLLSWCDPRCKRPPSILKNLEMTLAISKKYGMNSIFEQAQKDLLAHDSVESEPLRVFAIAIRFRLDEVARRAAQATLRVSLSNCHCSQQLKHVSAFALHNLHSYHFKCRKAVRALLASDLWADKMKAVVSHLMPDEESKGQLHTHGPKYFSLKKVLVMEESALWLANVGTAPWWSAYVDVMMNNLIERPSGFSVPRLSMYLGMHKLISLDECKQCKTHGHARLNEVSQFLSDAIDKAVSEVPFEVAY